MSRVKITRHHFYEVQFRSLVVSLRIYPEVIGDALLLIHSLNLKHRGTILENIIVNLEYNEGIDLFRNRSVWLEDFVMKVWERTMVEYRMIMNIEGIDLDEIPF